MTLTPLKIVLLIVVTLVLAVAGIAFMALGVHGSQVFVWIGCFLLLPCFVLTKLGVPIAIPFLHSMSVVSVFIFVVLQCAYYYALLWLGLLVIGRAQRRPAP